MRALIPLYVTTFVLQGGGGLLITLLTVRASREGFSATSIGLIGTLYFVGFLLGTLTATRLIALVGHIRVFSALAATAAAGTLALVLYIEPFSWMAIRFIMGFCFSGLFTVLESWLNGAAANAARGRVLSTYGFVDLVAATGSQLLLPVLGADGFDAIAVTAMLLTLSLVPIAITPTAAPAHAEARSIAVWEVWRVSPLAFVGCFIVGLTNSAFRTVGPLYAHEIGLGIAGVAFFMSAGIAGGALLQMPLGWLSDRFDRRRIMLLATACASLAGAVLAALSGSSDYIAYGSALLFGAFAMPLYSLSAAHANDFAKPGQYSTVAAGLLFTFAVGAAAGPTLGSLAINALGPAGLFVYIAIAHASLIVWALIRMAVRPTVPRAERVRYKPEIHPIPAGPVDYSSSETTAPDLTAET
ncbi:MAG: MFS transporter [Hyphomicrobiaceae bacterium]